MSRIHSIQIGAARLTALHDGCMYPEAEAVLPTFDAALAAQADAQTGARAEDRLRFDINAYLLEIGGKRILIDAGNPVGRNPDAGFLQEALEEAGIARDTIDMVVLTHLHLDHVGGLCDAGGLACFPAVPLAVHRRDWEVTQDDSLLDTLTERARVSRGIVRAMVAPYRDTLRLLEDGEEVVPGLTLVALPGHTPGHSGYRIESEGESLLIWADIIHSHRYQFAIPDWSVVYDLDGAQARRSRLAILSDLAGSGERVAGMHLDFPGIGRVETAPMGYRFVPV